MDIRALQKGNPGEIDRLYALDVLCFEEPFRFSREAMRRFATASNALVRLAVEPLDHLGPAKPAASDVTEGLLGFCIVHLEPFNAGAADDLAGYVVTLDVNPRARGRGVATRLMRTMEAAAAAAGAAWMKLHVFRGNTAAIRLYEALGYRAMEVVCDFYGPELDALLYQRSLLDRETLSASQAG